MPYNLALGLANCPMCEILVAIGQPTPRMRARWLCRQSHDGLTGGSFQFVPCVLTVWACVSCKVDAHAPPYVLSPRIRHFTACGDHRLQPAIQNSRWVVVSLLHDIQMLISDLYHVSVKCSLYELIDARSCMLRPCKDMLPYRILPLFENLQLHL